MAPSQFPFNGSARKRTEAPQRCRLCPPLSQPSKNFRSLREIMEETKTWLSTSYDQVVPYAAEEKEAAQQSKNMISSKYDEVKCEKCESGDAAEEMLLCDECDKGFHIFCLRPIVVRVPIGSWFCPTCSVHHHNPIVTSFPLVQRKIVDFFRIQKYAFTQEKCLAIQDGRKRKRRSGPLVIHKKRRRLLPFHPTGDNTRRLEQMASLASALRQLKMKFSNDLTYMRGMAPRSANQAMLEKGGMQALPKEDIATLELCRAMCKRGDCPPLFVVFDPCEGFTVEADSHIKDMTLIAEYTGDVDYIKNREHDDCDSMMTLLLAANPSNSLVICPDKRGNIARFINGINNYTPEGKKKQNLKCIRYNVNGECRVLLVATRDIAKGERIYYDYNGKSLDPVAEDVFRFCHCGC